METGKELPKSNRGLTFEEVQALSAKWPTVVQYMAAATKHLKPGYFGDPDSYDQPSREHAWKMWELDRAEKSMLMCRGCSELTQCKQVDGMNKAGFGGGVVGKIRVVNLVAGYLASSVQFCRFELLRQQAKERPWVEKRNAEMTFHGFVVTDGNRAAFNAASKYVRNMEENIRTGRGLVIFGPTGVGKTHLVSAIFREAVAKEGVNGSFLGVPAFLDELRSRYGEKTHSEQAAAYLAATLGVDLLVLDNLELRNVTPWVVDTLFHIVNSRYQIMKPLIITTGWTPEQMSTVLEEKVPSRLAQTCGWYSIDDVDWRKAKAKQDANKRRPGKPRQKN